MALGTHKSNSMVGALKDPQLRRQVRRRQGGFQIVEKNDPTSPTTAQPSQPVTALAAVWRLQTGQALVFQFGWSEDILRFRARLYMSARGSTAKFVTRSHKNLLVVLRVE